MENITYLVIEEAPVDYPTEVFRCNDEYAALRASDALAATRDDGTAFMVMTESEWAEYREECGC